MEGCTFDLNNSDADLLFLQEVLYAQVSGRTLIANPLHLSVRSSTSAHEEDASLVAQWIQDAIRHPCPENLAQLSPFSAQPNVAGLAVYAAQILFKLKLTNQSQSVLVRGNESFDKWSQVQSLVNLLLQVSCKKSSLSIHSKIPSALRVLGSFFHTANKDNPNIPFGGLCIELLLDSKHRIVGVQFLDYLLNPCILAETPLAPLVLQMFVKGASHDVASRFGLSKLSLSDRDASLTPSSAQTQWEEFLSDLTALGISGKTQEAVMEVLAAVYHLCQLDFVHSQGANSKVDSVTAVSNPEMLRFISSLLHVPSEFLEMALLSSTVEMSGERCTKFHTPEQAAARAKQFAETLYALVFKWLLEFVNVKLNKKNPSKKSPAFVSSISILHFPEIDAKKQPSNGSDWASLVQYANHCLDYFSVQEAANTHAIFQKYNVPVPDFQLRQRFPENPLTDKSWFQKIQVRNAMVSYDLLQLFNDSCTSNFVQDLFRLTSLSIALDEGRSGEIQTKPLRRPFLKTKKLKKNSSLTHRDANALVDLQNALQDLISGMQTSQVHYFFCHFNRTIQMFLKQYQSFPKMGALEAFIPLPNLVNRYKGLLAIHQISESQSDADRLSALLSSLNVNDSIFDAEQGVFLSWTGIFTLEVHYRIFRDWKKSNGGGLDENDQQDEQSEASQDSGSRDPTEVTSENFDIFCSQLDTVSEANSRRKNRTVSVYSSISERSMARSETTCVGQEDRATKATKKFQSMASPGPILPEPLNQQKDASLRRRWIMFVKLFTFWIPGFVLSMFGKKTTESQMAWREKFTIFTCIVLLSVLSLFFILFASIVVCPRANYFSSYEMGYLSSNPNVSTSASNPLKIYAAIRGNVYNLGELTGDATYHAEFTMRQLQSMDLSMGFPADYARYCGALMKDASNFRLTQQSNPLNTLISANHAKGGSKTAQGISTFLSTRKKGVYAVTLSDILTGWTSNALETPLKRFAVHGKVYDLTDYYLSTANGRGEAFLNFPFRMANSQESFKLDQYISQKALEGVVDLTKDTTFMNLWNSGSGVRLCIENAFHAGYVDDRGSLKCMITNYVMFAISMILCSIISVKFLAALATSRTVKVPAKMDKFVMVQVPCYTEDETTLRESVNALAATEYDDKKKLLVFICDGMIVGRGNDKPTPRILLDILGFDSSVQVEPLSYQALGEGRMQHNMAKVYTGLYEHRGHLVPYMVLVKCGLSKESVKPGNRGKRDSQMLLMRFLNKLHNDHPMSPLELEMRYQLQYIIGVDPVWYEFLLMVDADTVVEPSSLTHMIAFCMTDTDVIGVCGETKLVNEKRSLVTMIQVYEYFISHHLSKAFESMFSTVTCLPGCFSMYRIFSSRKNKPILASDQIIQEYGDNHVNTLHEKNLLVLGEDRYLTTLILKTFPKMKTKFISSAIASTIAPESFSVLISQRRRWINSTLHNLVELSRLSNLCGFFLFSMRFVVMMELLATVIQPATVIYLFYMLYLTIDALVRKLPLDVVLISSIVLLIVYGGQVLVFIVRREFSYIVWMMFYILSIPFFGFAIPLYSFWHMDDFSWGSTRKLKDSDHGTKNSDVHGGSVMENSSMDSHFDLASEVPHYPWNGYIAERVAAYSPSELE